MTTRQFERLDAGDFGPVVRAKLQMTIFDPSSSSIASYVNANWG
jgi:hypothetical protein